MSHNKVEVELRVGLLDISFAQLLTKDHHLIEFPTLLLPEDVKAGSIVRISCERDSPQEARDKAQFEHTQDMILQQFTSHLPKAPVLRAVNITQTSLVLGWDAIDVGTAELESLSLYKNGQQLGRIPTPLKRTATKLSNLAIDSEYTFHLVLCTSAGTFESEKLPIRTHRMTDLSGITICLGSLEGSEITKDDLEETVERLGAKPIQDTVKLDTTHFICTNDEGRQAQRAKDLSIPVVRPEWLKACEMERRLVGVRQYYLTADPRLLPPVVARNVLATPTQADSSGSRDSSDSDSERESASVSAGQDSSSKGTAVSESSKAHSNEEALAQVEELTQEEPLSATAAGDATAETEPVTTSLSSAVETEANTGGTNQELPNATAQPESDHKKHESESISEHGQEAQAHSDVTEARISETEATDELDNAQTSAEQDDVNTPTAATGPESGSELPPSTVHGESIAKTATAASTLEPELPAVSDSTSTSATVTTAVPSHNAAASSSAFASASLMDVSLQDPPTQSAVEGSAEETVEESVEQEPATEETGLSDTEDSQVNADAGAAGASHGGSTKPKKKKKNKKKH